MLRRIGDPLLRASPSTYRNPRGRDGSDRETTSIDVGAEDVGRDTEETFGQVPPPLDTIPEADAATEWPSFEKYAVGESTSPAKDRELIGLAVAGNTECPYCAHLHREAAGLHGSGDEFARAYSLSSPTPRYSAVLHTQQYDLVTFERHVSEIADTCSRR